MQRVVEATAIARISWATRTLTAAPFREENHQPGELADFHGPPDRKNASGWSGPAPVVKMRANRGTVAVLYGGRERMRKLRDVRRFMDFGGLACDVVSDSSSPRACAWAAAERHLTSPGAR